MRPFASSAMVVEFISTPGAGKTTLLPAVRDFFAARGVRAWSVIEASRPFAKRISLGRWLDSWSPAAWKRPILWQLFYQASRLERSSFRLEHRELLNSVLRFQKSRPISAADRQHILRWFINLTGQYRFLKTWALPGECLLFDEGFTHRVVQLFASENESPDIARMHAYLDLLPLPDLIIFPDASLQTCLARVQQRGVWQRFQDRDKKALLSFMTHAHIVVEQAVQYLCQQGAPVVRVVNEDQPVSESIRQLSDALATHYAPAEHSLMSSISS